jgi:hypothetical protein
MFDSKALSELVEQQIHDIVDQQVQTVLTDKTWIDQVEQRIIDYVQDRIAARFTNISNIPDIVLAVQSSVSTLLKNGQVPGIENYVDHTVIKNSVDNSLQVLIKKIVDDFLVDPQWVGKIEQMITVNMVNRVSDQLSEFDVDAAVVKQLDATYDRWQQRLMTEFKTNGISDLASQCNLTIMDGVVVVENELVTKNLAVEEDAKFKGTLTVQDLVVKGTINTDNSSWDELATVAAKKALKGLTDQWQQDLVTGVIDQAKQTGIEFAQVTLSGKPIVDDSGHLNPVFKHGHFSTVGRLQELTVSGDTSLNETLNVVRNRVGINTKQPEMALGLWDEEVSIVAGKRQKDQAYIGTSRKQSLSLGVNRDVALEIDTDGLTTVKNLRIDRFKIGFAPQVPGYSGTRGDLVFNSDPKPDSPFAWVCLGGFKWQTLKAV